MSGSEATQAVKRTRRRVGEIERSVRRELKTAPPGRHRTLHSMAILLARAIDSYTDQLGVVDEQGKTAPVTAAQLSAVTKAHSELRATMGVLLEVDDDSGRAGPDGPSLPAPVWDPPQS